MSKRKNLLLLSLAAVFSAAVLVGCGETVDPTPGPVEETGYTLTVSKDSNVSEVVISDANGALSDLTGIEEGTRLSATVTCVTDYEVSTVVFDGVSISATNGVYNFVMPGKDATLAVTSVKSTVYSAITVEADDGVASFSITDRGMEVSDLTNVAEGYIKLSYFAEYTDDEGMPMIPDLVSYSEAIYWYIAMKLLYIEYFTGRKPQHLYYDAKRSWNFYRNQAYAESLLPDTNEIENIKNTWHTLIPERDEIDTFFYNIGNEQQIYNPN